MASHLPAGNLSALSYSERLCGVVLTLGAAVASQALFPYMADLAARREYAALKSTVLRYAGGIALVSLPVVGAAWVAAPQIVAAFFERGDFLPSDTVHVAEVLKYHALQIPFYISAVIASRVVLSLRASRFMLLTTCVSLPVNVILNYLLMSRMGAAGLALSTAGVYALSAVILYTWIFRRLKAAEPVSA